MENFFNTGNKQNSAPQESRSGDIKEDYQKIFIEAAESIRREVDKLKPENPCSNCAVQNCKIEVKDIFTDYPSGCAYRDWQLKAVSFLSGDYKQKLRNTYNDMMTKKSGYHCIKCGDCCRLAVSEFSYEQLKQKALRGDKFAKDFVSVYLPYNSVDEAKNANPEYFEKLNELVDNKIYYYYCPKLEGNLCSDYENRPDICREFPHNPLKLLPSECSYNEWKDEISRTSMLLKAKTDIIEFYKNKLG